MVDLECRTIQERPASFQHTQPALDHYTKETPIPVPTLVWISKDSHSSNQSNNLQIIIVIVHRSDKPNIHTSQAVSSRLANPFAI